MNRHISTKSLKLDVKRVEEENTRKVREVDKNSLMHGARTPRTVGQERDPAEVREVVEPDEEVPVGGGGGWGDVSGTTFHRSPWDFLG